MTNFHFRIYFVLLFIFLLGCFSYERELKKYEPDNLDFLKSVDRTLFSRDELEFLEGLYAYHPDSLKPAQVEFALYLYRRQYNTSFISDTDKNEEQRRELFAKKLYQWIKKEDFR